MSGLDIDSKIKRITVKGLNHDKSSLYISQLVSLLSLLSCIWISK